MNYTRRETNENNDYSIIYSCELNKGKGLYYFFNVFFRGLMNNAIYIETMKTDRVNHA